MGLTKEEASKIIVTETTEVAYVNGENIYAENLYKWAYRRLETWPELLDACKHGAMSIHHPACSHGKRGDGNTCECHVAKCQKALTKAGL